MNKVRIAVILQLLTYSEASTYLIEAGETTYLIDLEENDFPRTVESNQNHDEYGSDYGVQDSKRNTVSQGESSCL